MIWYQPMEIRIIWEVRCECVYMYVCANVYMGMWECMYIFMCVWMDVHVVCICKYV